MPKFINLGQDARFKVLTATKTTIITASHQAFSMCQLQPICNASQNQSNQFEGPNGLVGTLFRGYPTGLSRVPNYFGIKDWVVVGGNITITEVNNSIADFIVNDAPTPADCKVRYQESASFGAFPTITEFTTGC